MIGCVMVLRGDAGNVLWLLQTVVAIGGAMGLVTAILAVPCGSTAGLVGRALRAATDHWLGTRWRRPITVIRGFMIVAAGSISSAIFGGIVGYMIGRFFPAYYRARYPAATLLRSTRSMWASDSE